MNFILKREFFTNIVFEKDIESILWQEYSLSLIADPFTLSHYEIHITGNGDYESLQSDKGTKLLLEALDIISFHRQSSIELGNGFVIYKEGKGITREFEYQVFEEFFPSGHLINDGSIPGIIELLKKPFSENVKNAMRWCRRALSVKYAYESIFFYILAVEALAGDVKKYPLCSNMDEMKECINHHKINEIIMTDKSKIKLILGREKYHSIYEKPIRNNLFHGKYVDENECHKLLDGLSQKISEYLKKELKSDVALHKKTRSKYGWKANGRAICLYDTSLPNESIPKDTPTIAELKSAYENNFIPSLPKNIRLKRDEKK